MCDDTNKKPEGQAGESTEQTVEMKIEGISPAILAPLLGEGLRGDAIKELTQLGAKAKGVEIHYVNVPPCIDDPGLPGCVPVGLRTGDDPKAFSVKDIIEQYRERPARKKNTAKALTLKSFIDLTNRHATEHSVIFADTDWEAPSFTAVIDYHHKNEVMNATTEDGEETNVEGLALGLPDFGQHRVHYAFPLSEEWEIWTENNGKPMSQSEFAIFLEDRIAELASPNTAEKNDLERDFATTVATPSELIQLSRGLQVHVESRVNQATTLQSGEGQIVWEEAHKDSAGKALKVPGVFMLSIAPFVRGETVRVPVRLRYRIRDGKVIWLYQLYRPDLHITERVLEDLRIAQGQTDLPAYEGMPEMAAAA